MVVLLRQCQRSGARQLRRSNAATNLWPVRCIPSHTTLSQNNTAEIRVRVEIMGLGKYENVGKSQPVLMMINPIISTRTRTWTVACWVCNTLGRT
jgi:hypothetical protein